MKLDLRALVVSAVALSTLLILIISVWSRLSFHFGAEFMAAYNAIHPHPFRAALESLTPLEHVYGVFLDVFYAGADAAILSLSFGMLYNKLAAQRRPENSAE